MNIKSAIAKVCERENLSPDEMRTVMLDIMTGTCTDAQIAGFLIALRMKGETVDEITAAASVMRSLASRIEIKADNLVDMVGTGGDASGTFNISTCASFVIAAAGASVAKHGNRSVSSKSGSADLLEAAGVNLDLSPENVARCVHETGVGFMFAPLFHGAMKHAITPRRELAVRTIFNLLGPLTNPAGVKRQLTGVFARRWVQPVAEVLAKLGSERVMVVHGEDGLDEISISAPTYVAELKDGIITTFTINPEQFGFNYSGLDAIRVKNAEESLVMTKNVLADEPSAARDIVCLNAGAAIYISGAAADIKEGVAKAREAITNGKAAEKLAMLVKTSAKFKG